LAQSRHVRLYDEGLRSFGSVECDDFRVRSRNLEFAAPK
jgi:hypothetical protein